MDCPVLKPKIDSCVEEVCGLGLQGRGPGSKLESMLGVQLLKKTLSVGADNVPKELARHFWQAVANHLPCRVQDDGEIDRLGYGRSGWSRYVSLR